MIPSRSDREPAASERLDTVPLVRTVTAEAQRIRDYLIPPECGSESTTFDNLDLYWHEGRGFGMVSPMPSEEALSYFYSRRYRLVMRKAHTGQAYFSSPNYRAQALSQVSWVKPLVASEGRWLDVGAGFGLLLWQVNQDLPGWTTFAVEPDQNATSSLGTIASVENDLAAFWAGHAFRRSWFDAISMSHVLEHLRDPWSALAALSGYLKPGGLLLIEVPHDSKHWLMASSRRSDLPHLWFYSERGLRGVLLEAGFEIVRSAVLGLRRERTNDLLSRRITRAVRRGLKGPLAILDDPSWYAEGTDRCSLRILCRKRPSAPEPFGPSLS